MKYSEKNIDVLIKVLRKANSNVKEACRVCGLTRGTFYNWKAKSEKLRKAADEISEEVIDSVKEALYENALNGHFGAQVFILKNKRKEEWQDLKKIDAEITYLTDMSDEELESEKLRLEKLLLDNEVNDEEV